jgi:hypothetical protein
LGRWRVLLALAFTSLVLLLVNADPIAAFSNIMSARLGR